VHEESPLALTASKSTVTVPATPNADVEPVQPTRRLSAGESSSSACSIA
jgi:hypothetical protein